MNLFARDTVESSIGVKEYRDVIEEEGIAV
jgi:hypothetical protein